MDSMFPGLSLLLIILSKQQAGLNSFIQSESTNRDSKPGLRAGEPVINRTDVVFALLEFMALWEDRHWS